MSLHENLVEYAVRTMMKGNSPATAAKKTAAHFNGTTNMFLGPDVVDVDPAELEDALWGRMADFAIAAVAKIKPGKEHYALGGTINHYGQARFKKTRAELKERILEKLGYDLFVNDDGT